MYDSGGVLPAPSFALVVNATPKPEPVVTAEQFARIGKAVADATAALRVAFTRFAVAAQQGAEMTRTGLGLCPPTLPARSLTVQRRARRAELRRRYRKPHPTGWSVRAMRRRGQLAGSY